MSMNTQKKYLKLVLITVISIFAFLSSMQHTFGGTVVVKPGPFDHFILQVPDEIIAGEVSVLKVQVFDANNNLITNFDDSGKEFLIDIGGSAVVQTALSASSFSGGTANISLTDKKAETVTLSLRESGGTVPVLSREITIIPNKLDHFILNSEPAVTAGTPFDIRVLAKDYFDNTVDDLHIGRNIKVSTTGTSSAKRIGTGAIDFKNGASTIRFVSEKAGEVFVELREISSGSSGRTGRIAIRPAALNYFKVQAPRNAVAGEPFDLQVVAYDSYDNVIDNYSQLGNGVKLQSSGISKIEPSFINPSVFNKGQAVIKASYEKAESIQVVVRENNGVQSGQTDAIIISSAAPDHFVVITPESAVSGRKFKIKVESYDSFNNIVKNYALAGNDVLLSSSGTGTIFPSVVSPSEFRNGIAIVDVVYDKAESFLVSATMAPERPEGRISLKEKVKAIPIKEVEKKKPVKTEKVKEPEVKTQKQIAKKVAAPKPEKKEKVIIEKKRKEVKPPPVQLARKEDVKAVRKPDQYTINKVSIIEASKKALLVINATHLTKDLEFTDSIESDKGKDWLRLVLRPAQKDNEIKKWINFDSKFIGGVRLEEVKGKADTLNVYIEILPPAVMYDVARVKNTLVVTVSTP